MRPATLQLGDVRIEREQHLPAGREKKSVSARSQDHSFQPIAIVVADPKWREAVGARLFLGIDHSAITVADTERSTTFYRDVLGMRVAGQSLNSGPTQEQLDDAPGAVVRVPDSPFGPGKALMVRDPDGHAVVLTQRPD